jgi:myo-inositol-1(or 4)-monophosphatase
MAVALTVTASPSPARSKEHQMNEDLQARYDAAIAVACEAGDVALRHYRNLGALTIEQKGVQDPVSEADRETEAVIKSRLKDLFPEDGFVGEETGADGTDAERGVWVVDPIDGTQPFLLGLPTWCVSIAYVRDGAVQIGVIRNPVTDDTYAARLGAGATRNGSAMHVREATALSDGLTGMGCSPRTKPADLGYIAEHLLAAGGMYHRTGSGALTLAYVAAGQLIGYVEMHINAWDCLAANLLVEEAGGRVNDFLAQNGVTGGGRLIAGAPGVYDQIASLIPG